MADERHELAAPHAEREAAQRLEALAALVEGHAERVDLQVAVRHTETPWLTRFARKMSDCSSARPTIPITKIAMRMWSTLRLFHSSHTQKPMPTPPVSISAATITSHATPIERRTPVSM